MTKKEGKGFGSDGWVGFVDSKRVGGGGGRVEWDIPNRRYRFLFR